MKTIDPVDLDVARYLCQIGRPREAHDEVARYLAWQLNQGADEEGITVQHVEQVKSESVVGTTYEVWDCVTTAGRWWVVTPSSNMYTQDDFKSADVVLTFHVGLTARILSRQEAPLAAEGESMFPDVWRKWADAETKMRDAIEAEDFQAVGMQLRETIIAFMKASAHESLVPEESQAPQASNPEWLQLTAGKIASGPSNARLRLYLKSLAKET